MGYHGHCALGGNSSTYNGEFSTYPGVHIINLRLGKAYRFDVYEDTQAIANGLAQQATAGILEAVAAKLGS